MGKGTLKPREKERPCGKERGLEVKRTMKVKRKDNESETPDMCCTRNSNASRFCRGAAGVADVDYQLWRPREYDTHCRTRKNAGLLTLPSSPPAKCCGRTPRCARLTSAVIRETPGDALLERACRRSCLCKRVLSLRGDAARTLIEGLLLDRLCSTHTPVVPSPLHDHGGIVLTGSTTSRLCGSSTDSKLHNQSTTSLLCLLLGVFRQNGNFMWYCRKGDASKQLLIHIEQTLDRIDESVSYIVQEIFCYTLD